MAEIDPVREVAQLPRAERVSRLFGREGYDPFDYQRDVLNHAEDRQVAKAAVQPGRQTGKTETGGAIAADAGVCGEDVLILAPYEDTVGEMMDSCRNHIQTAESRVGRDVLGLEKVKQTEIQFIHNGRIRARTVGTDGTALRGKHPTVCLVDEAAFIKDRIFRQVIEPFFSTHNRWEFYLFSTPSGKSGYFYEAVVDKDDWYSPHWPSSINPLISDDWLDDRREENDSHTFAQEYLGEFREEGDVWIPSGIYNPCVDPDSHRTRTNSRYLGVDPAERGDDRMVICDLDEDGVQHNVWSRETVTGPDFVGLLEALHTSETVPEPDAGTGVLPPNGYERIVVESNMAGLATDISQSRIGDVILPVKSTTKSKGPMYRRLKRDLEAEELTLLNNRRQKNQTTRLEYGYTASGKLKISHPDGGHDDYPDGLMLANAARVGLAEKYGTERPDRKQQKASPTFSW